MPAEPFQNRGASKKGQRERTLCFWSGSVELPFKRQSLLSSGTVVKSILWILPATWISWQRYTALWLFWTGPHDAPRQLYECLRRYYETAPHFAKCHPASTRVQQANQLCYRG